MRQQQQQQHLPGMQPQQETNTTEGEITMEDAVDLLGDDGHDDYYVGGQYDLGSGASLLVSYAVDDDGDEADGDDDIGAQGYQVGTTVELSFEF